MAKNTQVDNDEVNLIELLRTVWKGKWKIVIAIIISFIAMKSYQSAKINIFTAVTEIKPISTLEENKYVAVNHISKSFTDDTNLMFGEITKSQLIDLYVDAIKTRSIIEDSIKKFNLLDANNYEDDKKYNDAVSKLASTFKVLKDYKPNKNKLNSVNYYYAIFFSIDDIQKWKNALNYIDEQVNKIVNENLLNKFSILVSLNNKIEQYEIEDISTKINNSLSDYEREISDRISFLVEQAAIAEKLGIEKNTIEVQKFGNENTVFSNISNMDKFYLRGYEAINKEIELLKKRPDKTPFVKGLFDLEKSKRKIEQNKTLERLELELKLSPLGNSNDFIAASVNILSTEIHTKDPNPMLLLSILIGLTVGLLYVIISSSLQSQKFSKKRS